VTEHNEIDIRFGSRGHIQHKCKADSIGTSRISSFNFLLVSPVNSIQIFFWSPQMLLANPIAGAGAKQINNATSQKPFKISLQCFWH
jgi:hypothetical protein